MWKTTFSEKKVISLNLPFFKTSLTIVVKKNSFYIIIYYKYNNEFHNYNT
ncbi:hypothetical protein L1275_000290 [Flavobacterium sp. HSC-61S13]|nr:hypothetical protein [Flavobacterium sp. HSC-61S13]